ncbi:MAG TPA: hypothetical protein VM915_07400 [Verrucomicrobiae bacterium]|jgi:hypothetical protein|nr:hypothetical protein [Verrucomicrobiae bacterium]
MSNSRTLSPATKLSAVREKIARALNEQRPSIPANDVFERAEALIDAIAKK